MDCIGELSRTQTQDTLYTIDAKEGGLEDVSVDPCTNPTSKSLWLGAHLLGQHVPIVQHEAEMVPKSKKIEAAQ